MIVLLCEVLNVPLRERNALLLAAGYAPLYSECSLGDVVLDNARDVLRRLLDAHGRYPAIVVNRRFDILMANDAATRLTGALCGNHQDPAIAGNLMRLLLSPNGLRSKLVNLEEAVPTLMWRVRRELTSTEDRALLDELVAMADMKGQIGLAASVTQPFIPLRFSSSDGTLSFVSTITALGTPLDATLQELRIETLLAADDTTDRFLSALTC